MRLMNVNYCAEDATVLSASNIDTNFPVSNLKHPFRSKRVRTALGTTNLTVVCDLVTTEEINSVVLLWPKEDGIRLSNSATLKIQANATNVWTSPAVDQALTIDNTYMIASHYFSTDQSYRYWRVVIDDPGNPHDFVELGVLWLGKGLEIDNAQNGFTFGIQDRSKVSLTDFGHTYVDQYPQLTTLDFSYEYLEYTAIQTLENAFRTNGVSRPVLVVLDESESVFDKDHFVVYGKFKNRFQLKHVNYNLLNVEGIGVVELA